MTPFRLPSALALLAALAIATLTSGCVSHAAMTQRLPFHLAVMAPTTKAGSRATVDESQGNPTALQLRFDDDALAARLCHELELRFHKVSLLGAVTDQAENLQAARQVGADLILDARLGYDPSIHTALNDRFWLNLPLFALGGPFCWFVNDRSYYFSSQLEGRLYDVTIAASRTKILDESSLLLRTVSDSTEASLDFLDRADGVGAYLLSIVVPAGLIGSESDSAALELSAAVTDQLCQAIAQTLQSRAIDVIGSGTLVKFEPRNVRVIREGKRKLLVGEVVLELGSVADDLGTLRYRCDNGEFHDASWGTEVVEPPQLGRPGSKTYPFRIPIDSPTAELVQIEVEQLDTWASKRTFTYSLAATDAGR
ncbi:MAG: hypothetical protein KDC98_00650 [Planctomycetes bacterium]|nr:hypothetical protein [Planctomycetota bacterium]